MTLVSADDSARFVRESVLRGVTASVELARLGVRGSICRIAGGWRLELNDLASVTGSKFWGGAPSHTFVALAPFLGDEQRRFEAKVEDAIANVRRHCPAEPGVATNALMIKLPPSVSLETARTFLIERLDAATSDVAAVLLYRSTFVTTTDGSQSFVAHEKQWVENPFARVSIAVLNGGPYDFHFQVPIGEISLAESRAELHIGDATIDVSRSYFFVRGHHFYQTIGRANGEARFSFTRVPNISTTWMVVRPRRDDLRFDFHHPDEDELLLI